MPRKKKIVQAVENTNPVGKTEDTETESPIVVSEAVSPIQIPRKVLEQAEAFGIDLKQIVNWAKNVEDRFNQIEKWSQDVSKLVSDLQPLVTVSQQIAQQQTAQPQNPNSETKPSMGGLAQSLPSLLQLLPSLLGSSSNPLMDKLQEQIITSGLRNMNAGNRLLEAMENKLLSEMGAKIVSKTVEGVANE